MYAGSTVKMEGGAVTVTVSILADGKKVALTEAAPLAATQSSTLGAAGSVPRNQCVTAVIGGTHACDCGYPSIDGGFANGTSLTLNATAAVDSDGYSITLTAKAPEGFIAKESSYG